LVAGLYVFRIEKDTDVLLPQFLPEPELQAGFDLLMPVIAFRMTLVAEKHVVFVSHNVRFRLRTLVSAH
jgi:hypothetical protein